MKKRLLAYLIRKINTELSDSPFDEILYDFLVLLRNKGVISINAAALQNELDTEA